jgi:hypothetical protein
MLARSGTEKQVRGGGDLSEQTYLEILIPQGGTGNDIWWV